MALSRRQVRIAFVVGLVIGVALGPVVGQVLLASLSETSPTAGTVPLQTNNGLTVNVEGGANISLAAPFDDDATVNLTTDRGNATIRSAGGGNLTIHASNITGTFTTVSNITVASDAVTIDPEDKPALGVNGSIEFVKFRAMTLDDGVVDFRYRGPDNNDGAITVRGLATDTQIAAVDADTGAVLETATTNASGVATLSSLPTSSHDVELVSSAAAPILSDPRPNTNVSSKPSNLSVFVEDDEFPGDTVTLEFFFNGSKIDTVSAGSEGRYNTTNVPDFTGEKPWSVIATDENGNQDVINATVGVPGTLFIRNETNASQLVTAPVNVTVRFLDGEIVEKQTSDGTINMSGLPTTDFIVELEPTQNFTGRTVYIQSIVGQQNVYLLNSTEFNTTETRFTLNDPTANFPDQSVLYIQKPIELNGTIEYRTVHADRFGVEGVTATLHEDKRYRIIVQAPDGTTQDIGPYRSDVSETVEVEPGSPATELGEYSDGWASNASLTNQTIEVVYDDPDNATQSVTVWIYEKNNKSNQLRPNQTYFNLGELSAMYDLTPNESEKTWVVTLLVTRDDGSEFVVRHEVSERGDLVLPGLSREWRLIFGLTTLILFAGVFSVLNVTAGAIMFGVVGGLLWWTSWLEGATIGAAVLIYLFIAILYGVYVRGGP